MMVSRVVDAVRASLNSEGYSTLSNAELAARTGVSIATARRALKRAIQEGMLFSHGPNQTRRLSLVANPRTDRTRLALQIVEDAWRFGAAGYRKSQATVAEMLGVSVEVVREAFNVAIEKGWLVRSEKRYETADGSPRRAFVHAVTEEGKAALGIATATALPASVAAPASSKELEELRRQLAAERESRAKVEQERDALKAAQASMPQDLAEALERIKALEALIDPVDRWIYIEGVKVKEEELQRENWRLQAEVERLKNGPSPEEVEEESNLKRALTIRTLEALTYKKRLTAEDLEEADDEIDSTLSQRDNIYRRDTLNYKPDLEELEQVEEGEEEAARSGGFLPLSLELNEAANAWVWQHKENKNGKMGILEG